MRSGVASRSAMGSALLRAQHVREDAAPWVFEDEVSAGLLTSDQTAAIEGLMGRWAPEVRLALRVEHSVRSRLAEDEAVEGLRGGRSDYILLGAGLDTFAWRHPQAGRFAVWELDHPDTQAWKRAALARVGLGEPGNVRFVPLDLSGGAALSSLPTPPRATWNCMGVTMYLPRAATEAMLQAIGGHLPGTTLVVNFRMADDGPGGPDALTAAVRAATGRTLAAVDEPFVPDYTVDEVTGLLAAAGFREVTLIDAEGVRARYFPERPELLHHNNLLIAVARI